MIKSKKKKVFTLDFFNVMLHFSEHHKQNYMDLCGNQVEVDTLEGMELS